MVVILMGVTGAGKTTVGKALAAELHWRFVDADDFHPAANIAQMRRGIPLTDEDREPWLAALHDTIESWLAGGQDVVLACSALKQSYRALLAVSPDVKIVYLKGAPGLFAERLSHREGHYMNPALLQSQFQALEEPHGVPEINVAQAVPAIVKDIREALHLHG